MYQKSTPTKNGNLTVLVRGNLSTRRSRRELDSLLFAIKDYIGLREQLNQSTQGV